MDDSLVSKQLMHAIKALENRIPEVITDTATPVSCVVKELSRINPSEARNKKICERKSYNGTSLRYGAQFINVDAETSVYHTERDCSYTLISVPQQEHMDSKEFVFQFKINEQLILDIDMVPGISFTYSAYLLTHRQQRVRGNNFFSIAAYANAKFYASAKQSMIPCVKKNQPT